MENSKDYIQMTRDQKALNASATISMIARILTWSKLIFFKANCLGVAQIRRNHEVSKIAPSGLGVYSFTIKREACNYFKLQAIGIEKIQEVHNWFQCWQIKDNEQNISRQLIHTTNWRPSDGALHRFRWKLFIAYAEEIQWKEAIAHLQKEGNSSFRLLSAEGLS